MSIADIRNNGLNPLSYLGVQSYSPVPLVVKTINPTQNDSQNFTLGSMWLNKSTQQMWVLIDLAQGIATWVQFAGGSGGVAPSVIGWGAIASRTSGVNYYAPYGGTASTVLVADFAMPCSGTLSNLYVNVGSNLSTSNDTVTLYVNGVATSLQVTITAGTTGVVSDTTDSVTIAKGDLIALALSASTTGTWTGNASVSLTS